MGPKKRDDEQRTRAPKLAISYLRFSSDPQRFGTTERRQVDLAEQWAKEEGYDFDPKFTFRDEGVSGHHGEHRLTGNLGRLLSLVERGEIPTGTPLVVEAIDRLTREELLEGLDLLTRLIRAGIPVQTLLPRVRYDRESLSQGFAHQLIASLETAHAYSVRLATRIRANKEHNRQLARESGTLFTTKLPAWLRISEAGRKIRETYERAKLEGKAPAGRPPKLHRDHVEPIPQAVVAIKAIFDLTLKGWGRNRIADYLNKNGFWKPPKAPRKVLKTQPGWRGGYVGKLLTDRRLLGEFQLHLRKRVEGVDKHLPDGEPLVGHFPAVIPEKTFDRVRALLGRSADIKEDGTRVYRGGGRVEKATNLFTHMVKCGYCGSSLHPHLAKGGLRYLRCDSAARGLECVREFIRYDEVERLVLTNCRGLDPADVLPRPEEKLTQAKELRRAVQELTGAISQREERERILEDQIEQTPSREQRAKYEARVLALRSEREQLQRDRAEKETALRSVDSDQRTLVGWRNEARRLTDALAEARKQGNATLPIQLRAHLRQLIRRIDVFMVGYTKDEIRPSRPVQTRRRGSSERILVTPPPEVIGGPWALAELVSELVPDARPKFMGYVTKRFASKEGRFVRVHFTSGRSRDLVPPDSLAFGWRLGEDGEWSAVAPDTHLERLLSEWRARRGR